METAGKYNPKDTVFNKITEKSKRETVSPGQRINGAEAKRAFRGSRSFQA